jgi:hypothetical protein
MYAFAVRLRRHLLGLGQQSLDLPEVEQCVAPLGLLNDSRDDVALPARELLVGHLPLGVAELLEDDLFRGLRADPAAEILRDRDLLLRQHLHLDAALAVIAVDLLEFLLEHPHVAVLGIDLGPEPDEVVVGVGVLLLPRGLVCGGHGLLEALQDRLEGDALLPL